MSVLFSFVGPIVKIDLYPKTDASLVSNKVRFKITGGERYKVQGEGVYKVQGEGVYKVQGSEDFSEKFRL